MRLALVFVLMTMSALASAQTAPPIHGVTGTIATDTSIRDEHGLAHGIARGATKLMSLGRQRTGENPLDVLIEGSHVAVRDAETSAEGVVIDVNRNRQQITVYIRRLGFDPQDTSRHNPLSQAAAAVRTIIISRQGSFDLPLT